LGARRDAPRPRGRIVNISSTSGRIAYPFLGAYAASKFAVEALSDSLRRELLLYDLDVIVVEPGAIQTPIWDKGEQTDLSPYEGTDYPPILARMYEDVSEQKRTALPVDRVSSVIVHALTSPRPKTRYAIVDRRFTRWWLPRFLPTRWFDWAVRKHLKMD
jgi:short-subunit dehydrogenase